MVRLRYLTLGKKDRGLVLRYLQRVSGYSRAQINRLVQQYVKRRKVERRQRTVVGFESVYTSADTVLLAETDALHGQLAGAATKKLCERMFQLYGDSHYERLAGISVSHLYNLRRSKGYQRQRRHFDTTRPTRAQIGERRVLPASMPDIYLLLAFNVLPYDLYQP